MSAGAVGYLRNHMGYPGVIVTDDMEMGVRRRLPTCRACRGGG
jgi:beta-glucosidase-like glycosyl hydrolase